MLLHAAPTPAADALTARARALYLFAHDVLGAAACVWRAQRVLLPKRGGGVGGGKSGGAVHAELGRGQRRWPEVGQPCPPPQNALGAAAASSRCQKAGETKKTQKKRRRGACACLSQPPIKTPKNPSPPFANQCSACPLLTKSKAFITSLFCFCQSTS